MRYSPFYVPHCTVILLSVYLQVLCPRRGSVQHCDQYHAVWVSGASSGSLSTRVGWFDHCCNCHSFWTFPSLSHAFTSRSVREYPRVCICDGVGPARFFFCLAVGSTVNGFTAAKYIPQYFEVIFHLNVGAVVHGLTPGRRRCRWKLTCRRCTS